jgi:hypothetical protein
MLTEENINTQLIPHDLLKKNKFRSDWPFGRKIVRKEFNREEEEESNEEDSFLGGARSNSSSSEDEFHSEDDELSQLAEEIEERMEEMNRMEDESYVSLESGHQSQLLNDEWDYSNSHDDLSSGNSGMDGYPEDEDRIIEEEIQRELEANAEMGSEED